MRESSIHITHRRLILLVEEWFDIKDIGIPAVELVNYVSMKGVNYSLTHRSKLENPTRKTKKQTDKIVLTTVKAARDFRGLWNKLRKDNDHVVSKTVDTEQLSTFKHCAAKALSFCETYDLDYREGFILYIEIFLEMVKDGRGYVNIKSMPAKHEAIMHTYSAVQTIQNDPNKTATEDCHNLYAAIIAEKTGLSDFRYENKPLKYVYFVYAAELANKLKMKARNFINAQFEGLAWTNGIPSPQQMVTKAAEERAIRWMIENGVKAKSNKLDPNDMSSTEMKDFWQKIKKANENITY